jgi:hypothetical protein
MKQSDYMDLTFNVNGKHIQQKTEFKPYQSCMVKITPKGKLEFVDITYIPKDPVVRPREEQKMYF